MRCQYTEVECTRDCLHSCRIADEHWESVSNRLEVALVPFNDLANEIKQYLVARDSHAVNEAE